MTPYDQEQITKNLMELTNTINLGKLIPFLISNKVYTNELIEAEIGIGSPSEQTKRMLLGLLKRGSEAFDNFIVSLVEAKQFEAAHILRPDIAIPSLSPTPRQDAGKDVLSDCTDIVIKKAVERYPGSQPDACYRMESNPRGLAVIFVNETEDDFYRLDAAKDKQLLNNLFIQLGYEALVFENTTKSEMITILNNFAQNTEYMAMDSFILAVSSPGEDTDIMCHGSELVSIHDITRIFDADNTPLLDKKPKIFIIQTCGEDVGDAISATFSATNASSESSFVSTDTIIAFAATPGYLLKQQQAGSSYVLILTEIFTNRAWNTNLLTMLMEVSRRMNGLRAENDKKLISSTILNSWTKDFYFNPGL